MQFVCSNRTRKKLHVAKKSCKTEGGFDAWLVLKWFEWMLHCHHNWTFYQDLNTSTVWGHDQDVCKSESVALHVVKVASWGERSQFYPDGWCRGRTRWWRCGSRARRSPLASPAGGICSGSRRTHSSLCTSHSTQALGSCCTNICNLKIRIQTHTHTQSFDMATEKKCGKL